MPTGAHVAIGNPLHSTTRRDNLRGFFEQNFPNLLRNVFGFDGQGWLAMAAQVLDWHPSCQAVPHRHPSQGSREVDVKALLDLLAPTGKLYREMLRADADDLIQFVFPVERLPTHTQVRG